MWRIFWNQKYENRISGKWVLGKTLFWKIVIFHIQSEEFHNSFKRWPTRAYFRRDLHQRKESGGGGMWWNPPKKIQGKSSNWPDLTHKGFRPIIRYPPFSPRSKIYPSWTPLGPPPPSTMPLYPINYCFFIIKKKNLSEGRYRREILKSPLPGTKSRRGSKPA